MFFSLSDVRKILLVILINQFGRFKAGISERKEIVVLVEEVASYPFFLTVIKYIQRFYINIWYIIVLICEL